MHKNPGATLVPRLFVLNARWPCPPAQLLSTRGYSVTPGAAYIIRAGVADADDPNIDSALLLKAGSLVLTLPPSVQAGGPYSAVRRRGGGRQAFPRGGGFKRRQSHAAAPRPQALTA